MSKFSRDLMQSMKEAAEFAEGRKTGARVTVVEAPDNATIAHLSINLASRGTVKIMTLPALPVDELVGKLKASKHKAR